MNIIIVLLLSFFTFPGFSYQSAQAANCLNFPAPTILKCTSQGSNPIYLRIQTGSVADESNADETKGKTATNCSYSYTDTHDQNFPETKMNMTCGCSENDTLQIGTDTLHLENPAKPAANGAGNSAEKYRLVRANPPPFQCSIEGTTIPETFKFSPDKVNCQSSITAAGGGNGANSPISLSPGSPGSQASSIEDLKFRQQLCTNR